MSNTPALTAAIVAVGLIFGGTSGCCRSFLYQPTRTSAAEYEELAGRPGWRSQRITFGSGGVVAGLKKPPRSPEAPWLLYFGGNAMALGSSQRVLERISGEEDYGLAVFAYPGYDGSTGVPNERALYSQGARAAGHLLDDLEIPRERVFLVGQSLGSGVAAKLAAVMGANGTPPGGLVLVSPYLRIDDLVADYTRLPLGCLVADRFPTINLTDDLRSPILILHGSKDEVIPVRHGRELAMALGPKATLLELPHRRHNDVWLDPAAAGAIRDFVGAALLDDAPAPGKRERRRGTEQPEPRH